MSTEFKKTVWDNPNKMHFDSELKAFNKQVKLIMEGNVLGDEQLSSYIRPYNEKKNPVGELVKPGEMQEWDLKGFRDAPNYVKDKVRELAKNKEVILYEFRYWKNHKKIPIGWIITSPKGNYKLLATFPAKYTNKYLSALHEAEKYISKEENKEKMRA